MRGTRAELADEVTRLRAQGRNGLEIAAHLGISRSYAYELIHDPTGDIARERKRRYERNCVGCGAVVNPNGLKQKSLRCRTCATAESTIWTPERIVFAIRAWAEENGDIPAAIDWNPAMARANGHLDKVEKFYSEDAWPDLSTVQARFGSWSAAIRAAGFTPRPRGVKKGDRRWAQMRDAA
jgi:hypothetical protein